MIKRRIFTKLRLQFGRHFLFNKMAVPYLLSGMFFFFFRSKFRRWKRNRFLPKRVSSAVMFSIFGSGSCEEVHYCGKWFLRQWRYGVFSEGVWSSSGRKKQVDFSQRLGKTSRFFFVVFKSRLAFSTGKEKHHYEFFFQMCRSCSPSSLIRHSQSSRWFFSVVLLEDVIVEDWGGFTNSCPREGPGNRYCDQILTIGVAKMLERRRRSSSSG